MKTYKVIVNSDGIVKWYNEQDQLHCEHGPAVEYPDGSKYWYQNGKLHRLDGPAREWGNGDKEYWINGIYYGTKARFEEKVKELTSPLSCDGKIVTIEGKQYKLQELK